MLSSASDFSSLSFKICCALNLKGILLLATSLWLLWNELASNCFPEVPSNDCKATVLPPLFLMAIFSLYVGAFLMGLFREAFTTLPRKFNARYISGRISWLAGMLMFLYNLPFMLFVFKLGLKRLYTDPETLDQDSEEVMEVFGMLLVEVMLGMRAFAVCLVVAILLSFARWSAIHEASLGLVTSCAATSASAATSSAFVARKAEEFYRPRIQACVHSAV